MDVGHKEEPGQTQEATFSTIFRREAWRKTAALPPSHPPAWYKMTLQLRVGDGGAPGPGLDSVSRGVAPVHQDTNGLVH